jgi:hypothetical protein
MRIARHRLWNANTAKLAAGIMLLSAVLFGQRVYGMATAGQRLDPALRDATGPVDVVVVLGFQPERYHNERLAGFGVFAGRDRAVTRIRLQRVTPENLRRLATTSWVAHIEPSTGGRRS